MVASAGAGVKSGAGHFDRPPLVFGEQCHSVVSIESPFSFVYKIDYSVVRSSIRCPKGVVNMLVKLLWSLAVASVVASGGGLAVILLKPAEPVQAKGPQNPSDPADKKGQLPIAQVVLFSSGVGYFQREGTVEGNTRVDLSFPVQDINDLLKSMVVRDLDGGVISTVSYDSNAPVEKTLKSFAINLNGNPSFGAILNQARGEKVEVVLQQTNATQPGTLTGTVVGLENQKQAVGKDTVEVELLNLWCADGMRSVKLTDVQRVRFLNPIIESEFKKALETLALSHDTQKKAVSINCAGEGKRQHQGRLRRRESDLEDELSARAGQGSQGEAVPARLGHRRESDR